MSTGTVLYWRTKQEPEGNGFGFIADDSAPGIREANVWFGPKALAGLTVKSGDRVEFELSDFRKPGRGPQAARVTLIDEREEITTLEGIDDVA